MTRFPGLIHVDQALVRGAAEGDHDILLRFHEFTVHEHVDIGKELIRHFAARAAGCQEIRFVGVPRVAPDVLFRVELLHPAAELHEFPLVIRFHRLAPEEREPVDVRGFQHLDDLILSFLSVDVTVLEDDERIPFSLKYSTIFLI